MLLHRLLCPCGTHRASLRREPAATLDSFQHLRIGRIGTCWGSGRCIAAVRFNPRSARWILEVAGRGAQKPALPNGAAARLRQWDSGAPLEGKAEPDGASFEDMIALDANVDPEARLPQPTRLLSQRCYVREIRKPCSVPIRPNGLTGLNRLEFIRTRLKCDSWHAPQFALS